MPHSSLSRILVLSLSAIIAFATAPALVRYDSNIQKVRPDPNNALKVRTFAVAPATPIDEDGRARVGRLTESAYNSIAFMLYGDTGRDAAKQQGRQMEYHLNDPSTGRITVVDTKDNLKRVAEYVETFTEVTRDAGVMLSYRINCRDLWGVVQAVCRGMGVTNPQWVPYSFETNRRGGGRAQGTKFVPGRCPDPGMRCLAIPGAALFADPLTSCLYVRSRDPKVFHEVERLVAYYDKVYDPIRKVRAEGIQRQLAGRSVEDYLKAAVPGATPAAWEEAAVPASVGGATGEESRTYFIKQGDFLAAIAAVRSALKSETGLDYEISHDVLTQEIVVRSRDPRVFEIVKRALEGKRPGN